MNKKLRIICIILAVFVLFTPVALTFSRYLKDYLSNYYLQSKQFYFNSDKLFENTPTYQINNWSGVGTFTFDVTLDSMKNELEKSTADIDYKISFSCESSVICTTTKNEGTIYAASSKDTLSVSVTPMKAFNDGESTTIYISATSLAPYEKTIAARFIMTVGKRGVSYEIVDTDNSPYLKLNITNALTFYRVDSPFLTYQVGDEIEYEDYLALSQENQAKCTSSLITLTFDPTVVLLDTTNEIADQPVGTSTTVIDGHEYINRISFKVEAMSSNMIRFYKRDKSKNYTYPFGTTTSVIQFQAS